jgi:ribonucleotide reductase alpha subunit
MNFVQMDDLNLPAQIIDSVTKKRTNEELKVYALSLPKIMYPDTYKLAGRILLSLHVKTCPKTIKQYVEILDAVLNKETKEFYLDHEEVIDKLLEETFEFNFKHYNILSASSCINYLLKLSHNECAIETPCQLFLRQAVQFHAEEGIDKVINCYNDMLDQKYVHASPTMFNAGTKKNQMSSCFLLTIGDNLESLLYSGVGDMGVICKSQGGIGASLNHIRHSEISNTGKSSGVLPFGRIYDSTVRCVDQGGKRNGAITLTLIDWHIDFYDFIQTRDNYTQNGIRYKQANICAYLSDLFMQRVKNKEKWTLFCPARAKIEKNGKVEKLLNKHGKDFETFYVELEKHAIEQKNQLKELDSKLAIMETKVNSTDVSDEEMFLYHKSIAERLKLRKKQIEFKVMDADKIYKTICDMHNKSSMPYIVYRDTCNYKNNMMNIGTCEGPNLCLEIIEPSTPDSIASCNLGQVNLKRFVKGTFTDMKKQHPDLSVEELLSKVYDFEMLSYSTHRLVDNINKVIDKNRYPLDKVVDGKIVRGKISIPNFDNRPIGIGLSGLAEVFALLDIYYDSDEAFVLNKMIFACMYYNAVSQSIELAKVHGEYKNFRTGKSKLFVDNEWKELDGSPMSNGFFQFDLWQQEAEYLKSIGRLNEKVYDMNDNKPVDPKTWGQTGGSWETLRTDVVKHGVYNSMLIALMPTASSAQMLNNAETTEAHQTLLYSRKLVHGNFTSFSEPFIEDMVKHRLWNKESIDFVMMCNGSISKLDRFMSDKPEFFPEEYYKDGVLLDSILEVVKHLQKKHRGMYEISQKVTMKMARDRGIYVCQSQSLNIYLPEPTVKKMAAVHHYSNDLQLKTGMYYLRQNPASQTSRFTVDIDIQEYHKSLVDKPRKTVKKMGNRTYECSGDACIMCQ